MVIATGTPEDIVKVKASYTGQYLAPVLKAQPIEKVDKLAKRREISRGGESPLTTETTIAGLAEEDRKDCI